MYAIAMRTQTAFASKYLQQLCKHFAHKVSVTYDETKAEIDFPFGFCRMTAEEDALKIHCQTSEEGHLLRARTVIDDHLLRFAWKEELELVWAVTDPL